LLIYDDNYILTLGAHNINDFKEMVKSKVNATAVLLIYARNSILFFITNISCSLVSAKLGLLARVQQPRWTSPQAW